MTVKESSAVLVLSPVTSAVLTSGVPDSSAGMSGSRMTGMMTVTVVASGNPMAPSGSGSEDVKETVMSEPSTTTSPGEPTTETSPLRLSHGGRASVSTALVQPPMPELVQVTSTVYWKASPGTISCSSSQPCTPLVISRKPGSSAKADGIVRALGTMIMDRARQHRQHLAAPRGPTVLRFTACRHSWALPIVELYVLV